MELVKMILVIAVSLAVVLYLFSGESDLENKEKDYSCERLMTTVMSQPRKF